jgi:hypothetical protein
MKTFLDEIGINIMQSIAGLFGSLLLLGKNSAQKTLSKLFLQSLRAWQVQTI